MKIKNKKTFFKPYKKINDNHVIIMWDYKPIMKTNAKGEEIETPLAFWEQYKFNHVPTLSEIKNVIIEYYNEKIKDEIINDFIWNDMKIWLTTENQLNYKVIYDLTKQTNGSNLPITLKFENNVQEPIFYTFNSIEELEDFYISSVNYIQKKLKDGWDIKNNLNWEIFSKN